MAGTPATIPVVENVNNGGEAASAGASRPLTLSPEYLGEGALLRPCLSWKLAEGARQEVADSGLLVLRLPAQAPVRLPAAVDVRRLVAELAENWLGEQELDSLAGAAEEPAVVYYTLERLRSSGLLQWRVCRGIEEQFRLQPAPSAAACSRPLPAGLWRLSSRALLRREGADLLLETPFSSYRCLIRGGECLEWLHELAMCAQPIPPEDSAGAIFFRMLVLMQAVVAGDSEPELDSAHGPWEFHDLWFYHRTSGGTHPYPLGATWRLKGRCPPAPVYKPCRGDCLPLPEPTAELGERLRTPFCDVLARRRSGRVPAERLITLAELGALLYVSARVQRVLDDAAHPCPASLRPAPSGGALHSLELYPLVRVCAGLAPGAYRYEPQTHGLERVAGDEGLLQKYLAENPFAMLAGSGPPQIKLVVTSRFLRDCWKYESLALRLVLQDLGCLYQTLSLSATALGLAACVLGAVNAPLVSRALGLELFAEPPLGVLTLSAQA